MNKVLKFKQSADSRVFLTSDWHIYHNPRWLVPIWKQRGFNSVEESNEYIIHSINDNVRVNDILINLGDLTLNCSESQFEELLTRIKCQSIYHIWGNHNSPSWTIYRREVSSKYIDTFSYEIDDVVQEFEVYPFAYRNLIFVGNYLEFSVDSQYSVASHYSLEIWNRASKNSFMLHGHSHGNLKTSLPNELNSGKKLDVSWDIFRKPISFDEVKTIMNRKCFKSVDHHG